MKTRRIIYRIPRKSDRKKLDEKIKDLLRQILIIERGDRDELTGRPGNGLGLFHILLEGTHPRLKFYKRNLLLVNWFPYHYLWHHDYKRAKGEVEPKIIALRGKDYEQDLLIAERVQPRLTMFYLRNLHQAVRQELKELRKEV